VNRLPKLIKYKNGNRIIDINPYTGTKRRWIEENDNSSYNPERPENIDLNLSYYCENNCPYCYLNASKDGQRFETISEVISALESVFQGQKYPGLEIAMNLNSKKDLKVVSAAAVWLEKNQMVPNFTIKFNTLISMSPAEIKALNAYWLGVSVINSKQIIEAESFFRKAENLNEISINRVYHIINGIFEDLHMLKKVKRAKFLFLGYKDIGRGKSYNQKSEVNLFDFSIIEDISKKNRISFDNLMTKQTLSESDLIDKYKKRYLGEDGDHSFYIDLVKGNFSVSSTQLYESRSIENKDLIQMFNEVKKIKGGKTYE